MNIEFWKDKEWLIEQYIVQQKSLHQLEREFKKNKSTFGYWLSKYHIQIRCGGEAKHILNNNDFNVSNEFNEFIYGELLGDGGLFSYSKYTASICYTSKYEVYANWLKNKFKEYGIDGKVHKDINKLMYLGEHKRYERYLYHSKQYTKLLDIRNLFYPKGIKIVPRILNFTPIMVRQWYIGDGYLETTNNSIKLCTDNFSIEDVEFLSDNLKNIGINNNINIIRRTQTQYRIRIGAQSKLSFLTYIGDCPEEIKSIYGYKFLNK